MNACLYTRYNFGYGRDRDRVRNYHDVISHIMFVCIHVCIPQK